MNFIAIDFETANHHRSSACQLGLAKVVRNEVVETKCFYIRPVPDFYEPINKRVHGIDETMTADAKDFKTLWNEFLRDYLNGWKLVAHNAPFETSVFNALSETCELEPPFIYDTLRLSRHFCPDLFNFRLDSVCRELNVPLGKHHDAGEDAVACAGILLAIARNEGLNDLDALYDRTYSEYRYRVYKTGDELLFEESRRYKSDEESIKGKVFCFTGTLSFIRRDVAAKVIEAAGGIFKNTLSSKVDYLVVGDLSFLGGETGKLRKLRELREKGSSIEVLTEEQFSEMVVYEGKTITESMIERDSIEFLDANQYNILYNKNVCLSEGFPDDVLTRLSLRGAHTGYTWWEDEATNTDFFLMSSQVINDLSEGLKSPRVIRMENALNKQANPEGNPENHHIKFVSETALYEWLKRVEFFIKGKRKMAVK